MDDAALRLAISRRAVSGGSIRDFFDLAEALLDPDSIQGALAHLDRSTITVLALASELPASSEHVSGNGPTLAEVATRLSDLCGSRVPASFVAERAAVLDSLLLLNVDGKRLVPYDAVTTHLTSWPERGLPSATELAQAPAPTDLTEGSVEDARLTERLAADRAFAAVSSVAELVNELAREPARELSRGGLGLPDTKRIAQAMSVDVDSVMPLVAMASRAGLVALRGGYWLETEAGETWLLESTTERWATIALSWRSALPADVRRVLSSRPGAAWDAGLREFVTWLYPAGGVWMDERVTEFTRDAELIGITAREKTSTAGTALLAGDREAAVAALGEWLPPEVGQVYLQHDLSIVAPGPLAPSIDARLRGLADVESRELASSYRISAASIGRALAAGETAHSLLEFLAGISLTGIPQPLDYLIVESAARYGRVRVGTAPTTDPLARSYVRSDDAASIGTIAVDQTLAHLKLTRVDEHRLVSRFAVEVVFWSLNDARYPVAAESADHEIIHIRRHQLAPAENKKAADPAGALVAKLRASDGGESAAPHAWLARQLDVAIKTKQTVVVSIAMPGGSIVDYVLEPASVSGGRFRARDRRADIERTLPLSSVVSISPAPAS
ncbi:MAG TPA: helicase-associated domain-containing protein [Glaciibacter sp.]|nr:helicase-associated domain-containing protein [Glaciibacter sp.]